MPTTCTACGRPATTDFCLRADCLTYGSGAIAASAAPFAAPAVPGTFTSGTTDPATRIREAARWLHARQEHHFGIEDRWDLAYAAAYAATLVQRVDEHTLRVYITGGTNDVQAVADTALCSAIDVALDGEDYPNAHLHTAAHGLSVTVELGTQRIGA